MAASMEAYESWLEKKLLSLNPDTDTDVFVSYITGILGEDESEDDKRESLLGLLEQVVDDNQEAVCDELFKHWDELYGAGATKAEDKSSELTDHLATILESQKIESVKQRTKTADDIARKEAILAHYSQVSSGEEDAGQDDPGADVDPDSLLAFKNMNSDLVKKHEQEKKEKARAEAEKKREKDKQDRDAQKEKQKDRKENEKKRTQKGERRR